MTIELNVSRNALTAEPMRGLDCVYAHHSTPAWMGIDLSILATNYTSILHTHTADQRLMAASRAAFSGGLDFVSLPAPQQFSQAGAVSLTRSIEVSQQLCVDNDGGVVLEVGADLDVIRQAVIALQAEPFAAVSLAITLSGQEDVADVKVAMQLCVDASIGVVVAVRDFPLTPELIAILAQSANMVRLRVVDPHVARGIRFAIRAKANELGRDVPVVVDLGVVISATMRAARERSLLVSTLAGEQLFTEIAQVVGTVHDVADAIEKWVGLGSADGVVVVPASLPTDLGSLIRGVVPLLNGRSGA